MAFRSNEMACAIDILIRTYFRDFRWLDLALRSILKFVEGYRRIIIVMPGSSLQRLRGDEIPASARTTVVRCPDYLDDYLGQQVSKLHADEFTDAQLIAHMGEASDVAIEVDEVDLHRASVSAFHSGFAPSEPCRERSRTSLRESIISAA